MFKNGKYKKTLAITMLLVLALSTVAIAANNIYDKKLTATHGRIKFKVDGKDVTKEIESKYNSPAFTVREYNSRSYVPVRAIAELMGMKVEYDDSTHTAEIIDVKSEKYEKELEKKDEEIAELKKEIEKLKKNVVDETDLKALEKKLNKEYSTYKNVDFDIKLKESKNRIDVDIVMDLRDGRQENAWSVMGHNNKKAMIEDIADIISREFSNVDIYGSIYDEFYRRNMLTFNMRKNGSVNISYDDRIRDSYDRYDRYYIDKLVEDEFYKKGINDATISKVSTGSREIYFEIDFSSKYEAEWKKLDKDDVARILDRIADEIIYDYDYYDDYYYDRDRYYDDYYYRDVEAYVYMGGKEQGKYYRDYRDYRGTFK